MIKSRRLYVYNFLANLLPGDGPRQSAFRSMLLRWCGCGVGKKVRIGQYVHFYGAGDIQIGDNSWIASEVWIQADGQIKIGNHVEVMYKSLLTANGGSKLIIGDYTRVAHCCAIKTSHHRIDTKGHGIAGESVFDDIVIGSGCWICAASVITPGVRLGNKCVVGAGSVVLKTAPREDGVLLAGVPAIVKKRYFEPQRERDD